jgi:hypothetical protein
MQGVELMQRPMVRQWFRYAILKIRIRQRDRRIENVPCSPRGLSRPHGQHTTPSQYFYRIADRVGEYHGERSGQSEQQHVLDSLPGERDDRI